MNTTTLRTPARRYFLGLIVVLLAVPLAVFAWLVVLAPQPLDFAGGPHASLSANSASDPTGAPAELKSASLIERGEYLARAADCVACHTAEGGAPFAGGLAFVLPFGTLYSTNITPDKETGIGDYGDADFLDAVHSGLGRGGKKLYPAMPFTSYTYMTNTDALAIKAYLFSLAPIHSPTPLNSLIFPFNQRQLMGLWALLFNPNRRFEPRTLRDAQWNRGAYLVEAMGHCGECHTPRNLGFALNQRQKFAGAVQAGWRAYNITMDKNSGIGAWSEADLAHYLSVGHADGRGTASGPMGEAVDNGLRYLTPSDISAMVAYLRSVPAIETVGLPQLKAIPASSSHAEGPDAAHAGGKAVYAGACIGCHDWSGVSPGIPYATLTGVRSVNDPTAINVVQVILSGGHRRYVDEWSNMPAFGDTYSDAEIAAVANYVTARFGAQGSEVSARGVAALRAQH